MRPKIAAVIDFHLHLPCARGAVDAALRALDAAGVARAVCFGLGAPLAELDNPGVLAAAARRPDRLVPFAHVRLGLDRAGDIRRLASAGFRGLKCIWPRGPYDAEPFWPVYAEAERLRLPILFHTGIVLRSGVDATQPVSSLWMRPGTLDLVARMFPRLRIVMAHLGGPWFAEAFMMARVHPRVWLDVSSGSGWRAKGMNARFFRETLGWWNGFAKLMFATDQPHTRLSPRAAAREWRAILSGARVPRADRERFWSGNAEAILQDRP